MQYSEQNRGIFNNPKTNLISFTDDLLCKTRSSTAHKSPKKVSLSQVNYTRTMESSDSDDSLSESIFVSKT